MMMSPVGDHSRFDDQMKRDRCLQRSRSLCLKLGIRRQPSRESPCGTSDNTSPRVGAAPASVSTEHLPVVKEGILIDIGESEGTQDLLGSSRPLRLRTGKL